MDSEERREPVTQWRNTSRHVGRVFEGNQKFSVILR